MASPAYQPETPLSMGEVARLMSPREFIKLCRIVDEIYAKEVTELSNGAGTPTTTLRKIPVQFDVLDVLRDSKQLWATIATKYSDGWVRIEVSAAK